MFDLQARVGFDEDEGQLLAVQVHQEFPGAQALVAHGARHGQGGVLQLLAQPGRERRAGRDLDHLLEAPLQRAFALAQGQGLLAVGQDLHLDMARTLHQPLGVHAVQAEGGARLALAAGVGILHLGQAAHRAHAAPAAAGHGLEHHAGAALRLEEVARLGKRQRAAAAGHDGHAVLPGQLARARLVAKQRQLRGRGADEAQAGIGYGLGKVGALAQETIAGVDGVAAVRACDGDQPRAVQVSGRAAAGQRRGGFGGMHMRGVRIVLGKDGQAGDAQLVQRAGDADGDLAAVGDQDFLEHIRRRIQI